MIRVLAIGILAAILAFGGPAPRTGTAQEVQRIAAIVNDEVISAHDLNQRILVAIASTGLPDSPDVRRRVRDQVLRAVITERLQLQEAKRLKLAVTQEDVNRAIPILERQNNIPSGRFEESLRAQGVPYEAVLAQVQAEIAWSKVIRRRILPTVDISDEEVDAALAQLRARGNATEHLVSEIFLAVDQPAQDEEVRRGAARIVEQARKDGNFAAIARQFSQGTTAAAGGGIGWVQPGVLPDEVDGVLQRMNPGDISDPIRTVGGYYIIALRNRRTGGAVAGDPGETIVAIKQMAFLLQQNASPQEVQQTYAYASNIAQATQGCAQFEQTARQVNSPAPVDLGTGPLSAMTAELRQAVEQLPVGQASQPIRTPQAVFLLMVCERRSTAGPGGGPTREQMREQLTQRRVEVQARRLLRDLRRDAVIEYR